MTCGDFGGRNAHGEPCQRAAGWGRDAMTGKCMYHARSRPRTAPSEDSDAPEPPEGLSDQAAGVWRAVLDGWVLAPEEELVLQGALEAWDTYLEARALLQRDGAVVQGDGNLKRHPAALVARDAFRDYRAALRELGIESLPEA